MKLEVGDTFRVFEIVKPFFQTLDEHLIGKQSLECDSYFNSINLVCLAIDNSLWSLDEIKLVGNIRIKSLKQ